MDLIRHTSSPDLSALVRRRLILLLVLSRPLNLLLLGATGVIALLILERAGTLGVSVWLRAGVAIGCALLIMMGGYWLNDLYDLEIDRINRPERAKKVELVGRRSLFRAVLGVWVLALGLTCFLPWRLWLVHLAAIGGLFWYARWGKRWGLAGNVTIALLTGLLPWEILILTGQTAYAVVWMIPLAIGFNFVRELVKDAEDLPGDQAFGVRSLVLQLPPTIWQRLVWLLGVGLLGLSLLPAIGLYVLWGHFAWRYLLVVAVGVWGPLLWGLRRFSDYSRLSQALKLAMAFGLIALSLL